MLNRNKKLFKRDKSNDLPYWHSTAIIYYQELSSVYTSWAIPNSILLAFIASDCEIDKLLKLTFF